MQECRKLFYQKTHLEIHTRAHTGVKPFVSLPRLYRDRVLLSEGLDPTMEWKLILFGCSCVKSRRAANDFPSLVILRYAFSLLFYLLLHPVEVFVASHYNLVRILLNKPRITFPNLMLTSTCNRRTNAVTQANVHILATSAVNPSPNVGMYVRTRSCICKLSRSRANLMVVGKCLLNWVI